MQGGTIKASQDAWHSLTNSNPMHVTSDVDDCGSQQSEVMPRHGGQRLAGQNAKAERESADMDAAERLCGGRLYEWKNADDDAKHA